MTDDNPVTIADEWWDPPPDVRPQPVRMLQASRIYLAGPRYNDGRRFELHTAEGTLDVYVDADALYEFAREVVAADMHVMGHGRPRLVTAQPDDPGDPDDWLRPRPAA